MPLWATRPVMDRSQRIYHWLCSAQLASLPREHSAERTQYLEYRLRSEMVPRTEKQPSISTNRWMTHRLTRRVRPFGRPHRRSHCSAILTSSTLLVWFRIRICQWTIGSRVWRAEVYILPIQWALWPLLGDSGRPRLGGGELPGVHDHCGQRAAHSLVQQPAGLLGLLCGPTVLAPTPPARVQHRLCQLPGNVPNKPEWSTATDCFAWQVVKLFGANYGNSHDTPGVVSHSSTLDTVSNCMIAPSYSEAMLAERIYCLRSCSESFDESAAQAKHKSGSMPPAANGLSLRASQVPYLMSTSIVEATLDATPTMDNHSQRRLSGAAKCSDAVKGFRQADPPSYEEVIEDLRQVSETPRQSFKTYWNQLIRLFTTDSEQTRLRRSITDKDFFQKLLSVQFIRKPWTSFGDISNNLITNVWCLQQIIFIVQSLVIFEY